MSDNECTDGAQGGVATPVRCELLCFVQQKCMVVSADHLVKICHDFYKKDEIVAARNLVDQYVQKRLSRRQGSDMVKATLEDITKCCLDPTVKLPTFYAVDLCRIPPVDADHCDVTAILRELQGLRAQVREIAELKVELEALKTTRAADMQILKSDIIAELRDSLSTSSHREADTQTVLLSGASTSAQIVANAIKSGSLPTMAKNIAATMPKKPTSRPPVVGTSNTNTRVRGVETERKVDIFVSRLHPHTVANELVDCIDTIKGDIDVRNITCVKLNSKYAHLYSSYHVEIAVSSAQFKHAIDVFTMPDAWTAGVLVRRYFKPKGKDGE